MAASAPRRLLIAAGAAAVLGVAWYAAGLPTRALRDAVVPPPDLTDCAGGTRGSFYSSAGDGTCTYDVATMVPGQPGSLGLIKPSLRRKSCIALKPAECEVDGSDRVFTKTLTINVVTGPGPDLALIARDRGTGTNIWSPVSLMADVTDPPEAVTIDPKSAALRQELNLQDPTDEKPALNLRSVTMRVTFDHSKLADPQGSAAIELLGIQSINGGNGVVQTGMSTAQSLLILDNGVPAPFRPTGAMPCVDARGASHHFFVPDASGRCTDSPGVWAVTGTSKQAYLPAWTTAQCDCAAAGAACVVRDPAAYSDFRVDGTQLIDRPGFDLRVGVPQTPVALTLEKIFLSTEGTTLNVDRHLVTLDPRWQPVLIYTARSPDAVDLIAARPDGDGQNVDFGRQSNTAVGAVYLRALNGGPACGGFVLSNLTAITTDPVPDPGPAGRCGDGLRNGSERCDGTDFGGRTCALEGFTGGVLSCSLGCQISTGACTGPLASTVTAPPPPPPTIYPSPDASCGNNVRENAEVCDGNDLGNDFCSRHGFVGGHLNCQPDCRDVNTGNCVDSDGTTGHVDTDQHPDTFQPDAPFSSVPTLGAQRIAGFLTGLVGGVAVLFVIYGGMQYISAGADPERMKKARTTILGALAGIVITLLAYAIVTQVLRLIYGIS